MTDIASRPSRATAVPDDADDIRCSGLVRIFTAKGVEVQALQGLELRVARREMVALVGASGSGKSTLLTILAGLDSPTAGLAQVAGHDLAGMRGRERLDYHRRTVGFVWQESGRNLLPFLSVAENIGMAHAVAGVVPRALRGPAVSELLELLDVSSVADRRPAQLSGGQQQRAAIAVALANDPRVLLADEPTGELDEATGAEVLAAMETVNRERGVTTLIVTHDLAVQEHVDRTVRIRDGRTSTETLRSTQTDDLGRSVRVAEEYSVLDRAGRLQLPAQFAEVLGLRDRVRLSLEPDRVEVRPGGAPSRRTEQAAPADSSEGAESQAAPRRSGRHPAPGEGR